MKELIAYCGLYCDACSFRRSATDKNPEHVLSMPPRYDKHKAEPLSVDCPGCKRENLCGQCKMRDCAQARQLSHCGLCEEFPCAELIRFNNDGAPHHSAAIDNLRLLREVGEERWLEIQRQRWTCGCGRRLSWYVSECQHCGKG